MRSTLAALALVASACASYSGLPVKHSNNSTVALSHGPYKPSATGSHGATWTHGPYPSDDDEDCDEEDEGSYSSGSYGSKSWKIDPKATSTVGGYGKGGYGSDPKVTSSAGGYGKGGYGSDPKVTSSAGGYSHKGGYGADEEDDCFETTTLTYATAISGTWTKVTVTKTVTIKGSASSKPAAWTTVDPVKATSSVAAGGYGAGPAKSSAAGGYGAGPAKSSAAGGYGASPAKSSAGSYEVNAAAGAKGSSSSAAAGAWPAATSSAGGYEAAPVSGKAGSYATSSAVASPVWSVSGTKTYDPVKATVNAAAQNGMAGAAIAAAAVFALF